MSASDGAMPDPGEPLVLLQPLRHVCHACGNCCFGWRVRLVSDDERERIVRLGGELGVADPVDQGSLRFADGGCVFLDTDRLCRIHKTYGSEAKPRICRQFPIRVTDTEDGVRIGVDPGCTSTHKTWREGPELPAEALAPPQVRKVDPGSARMEEQLFGLADLPGMTLARFLGTITGAPATGLPAGFAERVVTRLRAMHLERFLAQPVIGPGMRDPLVHVAAAIATFDPVQAPAWAPPTGPLSAEMDAFALDVIRRQLFLRLGDPDLPMVGQVLVLGAGALACAWADPDPDRFAPALSSWARVMRMKAVWAHFLPRPETARWLATGETA